MRKYGFSALVAAGLLVGGLATGSASAADLGGNCCADLEERIAELEATTARKGNRKVSLTISGWVAEQVMWWDDDVESNVYVGGIGTTLASHFKLTGSAQISPGWSAGYVIHIETDGSDALLGWNQDTPTGPSVLRGGVDYAQTVQSYWFIKSDHIGKVSVGLLSQASDNTAILVDGSGSLVPANYVPFDYGGFFLRNNATGALTATPIAGIFKHIDWNGIPLNAVRYDSPTFGGFSVSASWGQDDFWDVAARYAGEWSGFKVAFAGAYFENTDDSGLPNNSADGTEHFQVGGYVQHIATGVWVYGAWGDYNNDVQEALGNVGEAETWYVKAGLREHWSSLGHTVLYGEYMDGDQSHDVTTTNDNDTPDDVTDDFDVTASVNDGNFELWGVGIVQEIDAAAMSVWLSYRNIEADDGVAGDDGASIDFQYVKFGALINF
jgi:hypothetical protein